MKINIVKILKKNLSIIIPIVIAVLAILLLIPSVMIRGKISAKLQESATLGGQVDSEIRNAVSSKQPEVAKKYQDEHQADANEIDILAMQTSQRELLNYKIFPEPNETSIQIFNEFKKAYSTAFANLIKDLKALDAPTDNEIRKLAGSITIPASDSSASNSGSPGMAKSDERIVELLCEGRSENIPVYANPWVFSGYAFWNGWQYKGTKTAVRDCWYCQLAYWIHKDIVDTINSANKGSARIADSSVKRLLAIRFSGGQGDTRDNSQELPAYVMNTKEALCLPWTARASNDRIDIIHFNLSVIVKADDVLKFMTELCSEKQHTFAGYNGQQPAQKFKHNQITILQSSIEPVNRDSPEHKRYYYGRDAVVYLNLTCEYVFNRQGYDAIKPPLVKAGAGSAEAVEPSPVSVPEGGVNYGQ